MENIQNTERPFTELDRINILFWAITYIGLLFLSGFVLCLLAIQTVIHFSVAFLILFIISTLSIGLSLVISEHVLWVWLCITRFNKRGYRRLHSKEIIKRAIIAHLKKLDKIIIF
jgi:hypothetical protein